MRNFASCYNEHAVKVSDSSRSCGGGSSSSTTSSSMSSAAARDVPFHSSTTCVYRTKLSSSSSSSSHKELLVTVTWSRSLVGQGLCITVHDGEVASGGTTPHLLRKKKGSCRFFSGDSEIGLYWDTSSAKYGPGPEPLEGFYVVVTAEDEFALLLGDMSTDQVRRFDASASAAPISDFWLVSRREQVVGNCLYSTKARFGDSGRDHEILIRCRDGEAKDSELSVCIDRKKVVHVRRLKWNFRGNQTIFVDGLPVDMMWDVHDWWFTGGGGRSGLAAAAPSMSHAAAAAPSMPHSAGHAVFMFRTRSALESRLWLDEEWEQQSREDGKPGFSLLIHAFKSQT